MLVETVELIGKAAAARLVEAFSGREIRVPTRQQGRTWDVLVQAIGHEAAVAFCRHFGGGTLYIQSRQRFEREARRAEAARMRAEGCSWATIAASLGYTERGARKLLEKAPARLLVKPSGRPSTKPSDVFLGVHLGVSRKIENR